MDVVKAMSAARNGVTDTAHVAAYDAIILGKLCESAFVQFFAGCEPGSSAVSMKLHSGLIDPAMLASCTAASLGRQLANLRRQLASDTLVG